MTIALHGKKVSRGIATGRLHIIERNQPDIPEYTIEKSEVENEVQRFKQAQQLERHIRIDIARRLIGDQHLWAGNHRPRNRHALLLPA